MGSDPRVPHGSKRTKGTFCGDEKATPGKSFDKKLELGVHRGKG